MDSHIKIGMTAKALEILDYIQELNDGPPKAATATATASVPTSIGGIENSAPHYRSMVGAIDDSTASLGTGLGEQLEQVQKEHFKDGDNEDEEDEEDSHSHHSSQPSDDSRMMLLQKAKASQEGI